MFSSEKWKDVPGYSGLYKASSRGRVKALKKTRMIGKGLRLKRVYPEKIMSPAMSWNGYLFLYLRKNGKKKFFLVHRIVALSFLKNEKNLPTVNHKNTKKTDNRVKNLEWMSYSGQQLHLKKERTRDRRGRFI